MTTNSELCEIYTQFSRESIEARAAKESVDNEVTNGAVSEESFQVEAVPDLRLDVMTVPGLAELFCHWDGKLRWNDSKRAHQGSSRHNEG